MTLGPSQPDYEKAAELAKAMRAGLDCLRSAPVAVDAHSPSSGLTDLATYADLESLPPLAKKGRAMSRIVRAARTLLRALLRPWLAVQTEFNHGVMAELDDLCRRIAAMENASPTTMPGQLHQQGPSEFRAALPVRQGRMHRHEADQDQAIS
jgi:hypothetical protein